MARKRSLSDLNKQEWLNYWLDKEWRVSPNNAVWYNIDGYNVMYMRDHNDPDVWTYRIAHPRPVGGSEDEWSTKKYDSKEEAKMAALERLAEILGKS